MNIISGSQQSAEWLDARRGMITASRIKDVMNILKNGSEGAGRKRYKRELAMERLTGLTASHYVTPAMEHGIAYEPIVRSAYELEKDVIVETVGFVRHPALPFTGASPDGLIRVKGGTEIKSPQEDTMVEWIRAGVVPDEHTDQCDWVMECAELDWIDFIAGHPRFKLFIVRRERDDKRLDEIRSAVIQFEDEVNALVEELRPWVIQMPELTALDDMPAPPIEEWPAFFDQIFPGDITQ